MVLKMDWIRDEVLVDNEPMSTEIAFGTKSYNVGAHKVMQVTNSNVFEVAMQLHFVSSVHF